VTGRAEAERRPGAAAAPHAEPRGGVDATGVGTLDSVLVVARHTLRESLRRRVFVVVALLTVAFLGFYAWGASEAFKDVETLTPGPGILLDARAFAGGTILGLAMFTTLFLGAVLAVFLTLGAVRGDAERGVLQPLVVRPVGRTALLAGRGLAAALVCALYVSAVFVAATVITRIVGDWWPDRFVDPWLRLVLGVVILSVVSLLGSVMLTPTANGIGVFMIFGAGLTAGLLGQIGEALDSHTLREIGEIAAWALPFEALYQSGLAGLTADAGGLTGTLISLGPFGGADPVGWVLWPYSLAYLAAVFGLAAWGFSRRDL
jgi:ABC-type transport system involved in multi-copper enzyme maturation permease subunit